MSLLEETDSQVLLLRRETLEMAVLTSKLGLSVSWNKMARVWLGCWMAVGALLEAGIDLKEFSLELKTWLHMANLGTNQGAVSTGAQHRTVPLTEADSQASLLQLLPSCWVIASHLTSFPQIHIPTTHMPSRPARKKNGLRECLGRRDSATLGLFGKLSKRRRWYLESGTWCLLLYQAYYQFMPKKIIIIFQILM